MSSPDSRASLFDAVPPRPWRIIPPLPGDPAFIRSADHKTVCSGLRTEQVGEAIVRAMTVVDAVRRHLPVIEDAYFGGHADDLFAAEGALHALRAALGEERGDV